MPPCNDFKHVQLASFKREKNTIFTSKQLPKLSQKKTEKNEALSRALLDFRVFERPVFNSVLYSIDRVLLLNHHSKRPIKGARSFWVLPRGM